MSLKSLIPFCRSRVGNSRVANLCVAIVVCIAPVAISMTLVTTAQAQQKRELIHGDLAPGIAAQRRLMGDRELGYHIQPVRIVAPVGTVVGVVANGSFNDTGMSSQTVGMRVGPLYRFRVIGFGGTYENEIYPSVELLDRLHPPEGLENQFPVMIVITENDLKQAISGNMVTKVIYLEDAEVSLPRVQRENEQPYFDVSSAEDPLHTARGLGRPMAILRIGSRVPTADELAYSYETAFSSEAPTDVPQVHPFIENDGFQIEIPPTMIPGEVVPDALNSPNDQTSTKPAYQPLQPIRPPKMSVTTWQNLSDRKED
jgi:hypothetical protein